MPISTKVKLLIGGVAVAAAAGTGISLAAAGNAGDDDEGPITGPELEQASTAALDATGGGQVTETEVGDEDSYYEVEVTLDDGTEIDVQLDRDLRVVSQQSDGPDDDDDDDQDDDDQDDDDQDDDD